MIARKIALNSFIAVGARILGLALSLIIVGLITRYLGRTGYGQYATVLAFLYFFSILADLGLYSICLRDMSRTGADEVKIVSNAFTLKFFAGFFIFALAPAVVFLFPYPNQVKAGVLIAAFGFWCMSNEQILIGIFQKYLRMDRTALAELSGRIIQLGLIALFVWQKMGFLFIVSAMSASCFIQFLLLFFFSRKFIPFVFKFNFPFWLSLLKKSVPLALAGVFSMIYFKLDTLMLSLMKPAADVGIYGLAYKILESLIFFPAMFVGLVMPLLSKYAFSERKNFKIFSQRTLDVLLIFAIPLVVGTLFVSDKIVILIGGSSFINSAGVLNILIIATAIIFLGSLFSNMIIALEEQKKLAYIYAFGAGFNLIANLIFIPRYSYYGAAFTTVATELMSTSLMMLIIFKTIKSLPRFRYVFKYIFAALGMSLILFFFQSWNIFLLVFMGGLTYFIILWLIGGLATKDILSLVKKHV